MTVTLKKLLIASFTLLALSTGKALAVSITATASGSSEPIPVIGEDLQNGDFLIKLNQAASSLPTGDGSDEFTVWSFDFSNDSNLASFLVSDSLAEASLTLTLSPKSTLAINDVTGIPEVYSSTAFDIPSIGSTETITINLLDFGLTSEQLLDTLNGSDPNNLGIPNGSHLIPWFYEDDSIVSFAQLELTASQSVPEPSLTLFAVMVLSIGVTRGKRKMG